MNLRIHSRFVAFLLVLVGWSALSGAERPNVLFIAVDDLRPELGCYGKSAIHSPNIDRLAATGVRFEHAYCQQAVCGATRNSLLSGLRPDTTGIYGNSKSFRDVFPDLVALPQQFKNHGYTSIALTNWSEMRSYAGIPKSGPVSDEQALELIHGYRACVSYVDAQIGRLLDELDRLKLADDTIVILWGDHGWKLGDWGMWCKHTSDLAGQIAAVTLRRDGP